MYGALAGSVLFSLGPDAQRSRVLLYLLVSVAPFAVVAPAIGPTVDRIPGGRRMVMQITTVARLVLYVLMASHVHDLLLYPLVFGVLVMQKTYAVSKSALVPLVVRNDAELVEANSKLGLISAIAGAVTVVPLTAVGKWHPAVSLSVGAVLFAFATAEAVHLPRDPSLPRRSITRGGKLSIGSRLRRAAHAMSLVRACNGFLTFHLFFWLRKDFGLAQFGVAAACSTIGSMVGNVVAPRLRKSLREEVMVTVALIVIAVAGFGATLSGGLVAAVLLALVLNFSTSIARMAFDSLVQRDAPDQNKGEVFARLETRFQLAWVVAGLPPVAVAMPGWFGFLVITGIAVAGLVVISGRVGRSTALVRRARPVSATNREDRTAR
jgi:nitrate reductase NapE component